MPSPLDLSLHDPARLSDDDFRRGFIARQDVLEKLLARLGEVPARGAAQHRLVIGQPGMGKTSLLRRIGMGVQDSAALSAKLVPLIPRAEQHNAHDLHAFWRNGLDALGDWFESNGQSDNAQRLQTDAAALAGRDDDDEGSLARELFRRWLRTTERRALLLLDNLEIVLDGLRGREWSLRRALQESDGVVVIGATSAYLEATARPDAAFYDFFQIDVLGPLRPAEILACLRRVAEERGEAGARVAALLDRDPARIRSLHDLVGGHPRTLTMLYLVLEADDRGDPMLDLERLLDLATPTCRSRLETMAPQARVVFDALALAWLPATAATLAAATRLEVASVSTQLDRLQKAGAVQKVTLAGTGRSGYQVADRFLSTWYLVHHGSRQQRARLRSVVEFLRDHHGRAPDAPRPTTAARGLLPHIVREEPAGVGTDVDATITSIRQAFQRHPNVQPQGHFDELLQHIRHALAHGQGERLLERLGASGPASRLWPLHAALEARVGGEAVLMNLCPEVQGAARTLFEQLGE
ncbi:MAG: ATP-binding protein [bacterium]|nr:ATP-binding protein [bacterium]